MTKEAGRRPIQSRSGPTLRCVLVLGMSFLAPAALTTEVHGQSVADRLEAAESLGWAVGAVEAEITVVEFSDVSCPYCASFHEGTRAELVKEFVDSGRVRWITVTYVSGLYPNSLPLSVAAECAGRQGRYAGYLAGVYARREAWVGAGARGIATVVEELGREVGLEDRAFASCRQDLAVAERIQAIGALARDVGVRGTPTWFVDGFLVMGDLPLGYARQFIESRLSR